MVDKRDLKLSYEAIGYIATLKDNEIITMEIANKEFVILTKDEYNKIKKNS